MRSPAPDPAAGYLNPQRRRQELDALPRRPSTCWSSAAGSPAPASPSMRPAAGSSVALVEAPRPRVRHQPLEQQAGPRRPALPGERRRRHRVRERPRARRPHAHHRAAPDPAAAVPGALQRHDQPGRSAQGAGRHPRRRGVAHGRPHPPGTLPRLRRVGATEARSWVSAVRADVTGGMLFWDGQLEDDARLVVAVARTAAAHGARDPHPGARAQRSPANPPGCATN